MENDQLQVIEGGASTLLTLGDLVPRYIQDLDEATTHKARGEKPGITTGFSALDKILGGWFRSGLYAMHGVPGAGKSALALQMGADCGAACLYLTAEMAADELLVRHVARRSMIPAERLRTASLDRHEELTAVDRSLAEAPGLHIIDATDQVVMPKTIAHHALTLKQQWGHCLVIVDSLNAWSEAMGAELGLGEYESYARGVAALRAIQKALRSPVLFLAERNKAGFKSGGLDAMAGHRRLGHGPDVVMELEFESDDKAYAAGHLSNDIATIELRINKNRFGRARGQKPLDLVFYGATMRFQQSGPARV